MAQLNPYINFEGKCREALTFYKECLGGELVFQTVGGSPIEGQCPAGMKDQILHGSLLNGSVVIMGSDMIGPDGLTMGNNVSLSLSCSSEEEINTLYNAFSKDGKIICVLSDSFWGARFGVVTDRFGINWMLNYEKPKN